MRKFFNKSKIDHEWLMAIRISCIFLIIGGLWIFFSDRLVLSFFKDPDQYARLQLWKGWFFVVSVAVILLLLIKNYLKRNRTLSESLQESDERFRYVIEKSVSGICIINSKGEFDYVNNSFCTVFGYEANEIVGQSITMLYSSDQHEAVINEVDRLFVNSLHETKTWDAIDKQNKQKKVKTDTMPITWFNGEEKLVSFVEDITARVKAEGELKRSERKYRSMMEALDIPLYIADDNCRILFANTAFRKRFGEVDDIKHCYKKVLYNEDRCGWCKGVKQLKIGQRYERELHDPGTGQIYQVIMAPIEFEEGQINKMIVMRDLTDIIKARQRAEESDRLKTAFLANMSHEVRTPLNAILGFSSILNDDTLPGEERSRFIDLIHQSGIQLLNIIDDIVDVARIEQGNLRISRVSVEVNPLLRETMDIMKLELADGSKPDLELRMENHLPVGYTIQADPLRLKQVLMNLLNNAIKFTRKGLVKLEVFKNNNHEVIFDVEDTGIGIPAEKMEVIFERFRQADESTTRVAGGNGLGLFISKNLIEQMGGQIKGTSTPGQGSTFSVIMKENKKT
ncbi:PAS domain-containing sensor histidine kinase [Marinilabilia rubra]|uniref:histidine kinase n=1 Tax=Marinilabilia rubra TaxID=2162893 RepID=A0A2U2B7X6_9BACT|nr:ATP-binding protein [Marinilabilia rubra]PWD99152.1 histidine kinase [Marinilabilia rubra]